jgi:hypothetical protein
MRVDTAIKLLSELPADAIICGQWYEKSDMVTELTDDEWELANAIVDKWEMPDMLTCLEEAIYVAKERLSKEAN